MGSNEERIQQVNSTEVVELKMKLARSANFMREFIANMLEASPGSEKEIYFRERNGVKKLAMRNINAYMTQEEWKKCMDLNSSGGGKKKGVQDNFGIGAKVSGISVSPSGVEYNCCDGEKVFRGIIKRESAGVYPKIVVGDVTSEYVNDKYPPGSGVKWVEVVFHGSGDSHDTFSHCPSDSLAFKSGVKVWIIQSVQGRFYDLTSENLWCHMDRSESHRRHLEGLVRMPVNMVDGFVEDETVFVDDHVSVRFRCIDRSKESLNKEYGYKEHACIVFKNECYDFRFRDKLKTVSKNYFGIPYIAGEVSIEILLSADFGVHPTEDRINLVWDDGNFLSLEHFSDVVCNNIPEWVAKKHRDRIDDSVRNMSEAEQEELEQYLREIKEFSGAVYKPRKNKNAASGFVTPDDGDEAGVVVAAGDGIGLNNEVENDIPDPPVPDDPIVPVPPDNPIPPDDPNDPAVIHGVISDEDKEKPEPPVGPSLNIISNGEAGETGTVPVSEIDSPFPKLKFVWHDAPFSESSPFVLFEYVNGASLVNCRESNGRVNRCVKRLVAYALDKGEATSERDVKDLAFTCIRSQVESQLTKYICNTLTFLRKSGFAKPVMDEKCWSPEVLTTVVDFPRVIRDAIPAFVENIRMRSEAAKEEPQEV